MREGRRRMNIVDLNRSLQGIVIGIGRIGARIYGPELRKSIRETLSDIYYRIQILLCNCIERTSIAGKITVQLGADATRAHFGGGGGRGVGGNSA
jgi:hypothetical protein